MPPVGLLSGWGDDCWLGFGGQEFGCGSGELGEGAAVFESGGWLRPWYGPGL